MTTKIYPGDAVVAFIQNHYRIVRVIAVSGSTVVTESPIDRWRAVEKFEDTEVVKVGQFRRSVWRFGLRVFQPYKVFPDPKGLPMPSSGEPL